MAQENLKKKIFPLTENYNNLRYDQEGLWSITHPNQADEISELILNHYTSKHKTDTSNIKIMDATAGIGGNLLSFSKYFGSVYGIELDKDRFDILSNNIDIYNFQNIKIFQGNCMEYLVNSKNIKSDIISTFRKVKLL